jgi:hypothetical protein
VEVNSCAASCTRGQYPAPANSLPPELDSFCYVDIVLRNGLALRAGVWRLRRRPLYNQPSVANLIDQRSIADLQFLRAFGDSND